ncbi:MAG: tetratricopeptide repeat protein [Planctomycetota bacterium]|nr:tetratricopeptide repeat protein [Planctomycetota bacterium]
MIGRLTICWSLLAGAVASAQQAPLVPDGFTPSPPVQSLLDAAWSTEEERRSHRIRHGLWNDSDLNTPERRAVAALTIGRLDDPALSDVEVPIELRAEALILRGRWDEALELLDPLGSLDSMILRARAHEQIGRFEEADAAVGAALLGVDPDTTIDQDDLLAGVEGLQIRARVQGRPSDTYRYLMDLLARSRDSLNRLDWRTPLLEARLLIEKHNRVEAVAALHETLSLNPRCAEAWYLLGRIALRAFDFDSAYRAAAALRRIHRSSAYADLLDAESALINDDPELANSILDPLLKREPALRKALTLRAASDAVAYDLDRALQRLALMDETAPGAADGFHEVGRFLALNRQYADAAEVLSEAVRRRPGWSAPLIELGLLEMQSGRDDLALDALRQVAQIDPFNERAIFSLRLLEELAAFKSIETDHFVIRYLPGVDEVVARMMPDALESMHSEVAARFDHTPSQRTIIEVMPDHEFFSVRITGMPWIHTVAACTGPVIAMEVPREGAPSKHLGLFDWLDTLRHEYTHTITLERTRNRIPHWLTEAAAVSMEHAPRDYQTAIMLATALRENRLFDLDEINWAFIRPKTRTDRPMAYAQGAWMVEYMNETYGAQALIDLLDHYFEGRPEEEAVTSVLGVDRATFFENFLAWARIQVGEWGFFAQPSFDRLKMDLISRDPEGREKLESSRSRRLSTVANSLADRIGRPAGQQTSEPIEWPGLELPRIEISDEQVREWLESHPDHPDLLELLTRRMIDRDQRSDADAIDYLQRYREARPIDPYPDRVLARLFLKSEDPSRAIQPLARLDALSDRNPVYATELSRLQRASGDHEGAFASAERMVRIDPYRPSLRELAAAISIEADRLESARMHIEALILLEPDRPVHRKRLAAIDSMISRRLAD